MYGSSIDALRELMKLDIVIEVAKISPKGYKLSNGVDYCTVELKTLKGDYLLQAYGREAIELNEQSSILAHGPLMVAP